MIITIIRIEKKVWPEYFQKILDGDKTFELRLADFKIKPGDILVLKEQDPKTKKYTGRVIEKKVSYVLKFTFEDLTKYLDRRRNLKIWSSSYCY